MYKPINGWTKKKILEVIEARRYKVAATKSVDNRTFCAYLTSNGNKCAVGLFIPTGHIAQKATNAVKRMLHENKDLKKLMPFELEVLELFQCVHDVESSSVFERTKQKFGGNAKLAMLTWVKENVEDDKPIKKSRK